MHGRSEAERCATASPATGFDGGRPAVAQSAAEGKRPSHTTNMKIIADIEFFGAMNTLFLEEPFFSVEARFS